MNDCFTAASRLTNLQSKVNRLFLQRARLAQEHLIERLGKAAQQEIRGKPFWPWDLWADACNYAVDNAQRSLLFWDTLRQRGNETIAHEEAGTPPMLRFEYEVVLDARQFKRPVNYALVRITPPKGVSVDPKRRPYVIIDPRAGHGPGIGGFKDDSQAGVALRSGHPVYFVIFFPEPMPGQSLPDVTVAEQQFVRKVRELHPHSPKPVIVGNCQGGWAAMMLAASDSGDTGPIVINGAPMSYWGGAWREGEGDNPMRYAGGLLGGTWLASLTSDLGNGIFDGAWLVQNFENLNPANTFWDKYYHLFANIDSEPPRFLEFERWWGGFYLMNRQEIEWITKNLFVGNKLWSGEVRSKEGRSFDLRDIKSPIILFASLGDNITPPQQAFNWVADVYGSTDEIKARGQVIIGLLHEDVGHLGIFVSGRVAKKEHAQIVSVLKSIEALPPGLYGMQILEKKDAKGRPEYEVQFVERQLEDVTKRLNRFQRADEKPFKAVERVSEFNQRAYELLVRPLVQAVANALTAKLGRDLHPLRVQRRAVSDLNPFLIWLGPAARAARENRRAVSDDSTCLRGERFLSECVSSSLDYYREIRDAISEALFYETYGGVLGMILPDDERNGAVEEAEPRDLPFVKAALDSIDQGGYPEAVARVFSLLSQKGQPLPLAQIHLKRELAEKFSDLLPQTSLEQQRIIRGQQDIIVRYEPERAIETLPRLVRGSMDRKLLNTLLDSVLAPENMEQIKPAPEQVAMLKRIRSRIAMPQRTTRPPMRRGKTTQLRQEKKMYGVAH